MMKRSLFLLLPPIALSLSMESCGGDQHPKTAPDTEEFIAQERTQSETTFVYDTIGGDVIFTICAGTPIESAPTEDPEWNELAISVSVPQKGVESNEIAQGEAMLNHKKEKIGTVERTQHFYEKSHNEDGTTGILRGFTKKANIDPNSVLENIIQKRCSQEENRTLHNLEQIVNEYDFVNYQIDTLLAHLDFDEDRFNSLANIEEYVLEDSWLSDPGTDRLSLVFLHDRLIAIVHKRPLKIANTMVFSLPKKRELIVFPCVNMDIADELLDLKREFYSSLFD